MSLDLYYPQLKLWANPMKNSKLAHNLSCGFNVEQRYINHFNGFYSELRHAFPR